MAPPSGSAPFVISGERIYAEVGLVRPDGTVRKTRAFVDLGGTESAVSPALFKELGLDRGRALEMRIGEFPVTAKPGAFSTAGYLPFAVGSEPSVEMLLPAATLQPFEVVIDYGKRRLTLARPGAIRPRGAATPFSLDDKTGLISVDARIDGRPYALTIDAGSGYTWLTRRAADDWLTAHPVWRRGQGAVGPANMRMADDGVETGGALIDIPRIEIGPVRLSQIGALAVGPAANGFDFMDWYSQKNARPVIGWLGGNALHAFRLTVDYPNRRLYWLREGKDGPGELDQVGLVLKRQGHDVLVAGVASHGGKPAVDGARVDDKLVQIGDLIVSGATSGAILQALHGRPGQMRRLVLERGGERLSVQAPVTRF
jgi:hypothetical protein